MTRDKAGFWLAGLLIVVWIILQVWLLRAHWINPDEGAHLMDVRLAMDGLIPQVDFGARQPLYVYAYVPFLRILGVSYAAGRVMPLLATLLSAGLIFLIGRRLWSPVVGIYGLLLYLWAPGIGINTSVVKTEPLAILLTCLGMYGLIRHLQDGRWRPLFWAGVAFGMGYYVRESTLSGLLAAGVVILSLAKAGWKRAAHRVAVLGIGACGVWGVVLGAYATRLPFTEIISSEKFFPLYKIAMAVKHILGWGAAGGRIVVEAGHGAEVAATGAVVEALRQSSQSWSVTVQNLAGAARLHLPWLIGAVLAAGIWARRLARGADRRRQDRDVQALSITFFWLGSVTLLYGYYAVQRGFFQFYFREFIPPMALLLAWLCVRIEQDLGWTRRVGWGVPIGLGATLGIFWWKQAHPGGGWLLALAAITVVTLLTWRLRKPGAGHAPRQMAVLGVAAAVWMMAITHAAGKLGVSFDCVWSPATVRQVVDVIKAHSEPDDEVLSGAVIWEFEANRRPFANITHPLKFQRVMDPRRAAEIEARLQAKPPRLIILDGYTEQTYLYLLPQLRTLLATAYEPVGNVVGSKYPVEVYGLRERAR